MVKMRRPVADGVANVHPPKGYERLGREDDVVAFERLTSKPADSHALQLGLMLAITNEGQAA